MAAGDIQTLVRLRSDKDGAWFVHPDLRGRLAADASGQGSNISELVNVILAKRLKVRYTPTGRSRKQSDDVADRDTIKVWLDPAVDGALKAAAPASGYTRHQDLLRALLCKHYDLAVPAKPRRTRARRTPAVTA